MAQSRRFFRTTIVFLLIKLKMLAINFFPQEGDIQLISASGMFSHILYFKNMLFYKEKVATLFGQFN